MTAPAPSKIVAICCPFMDRPTLPMLDSLEKAIPVLRANGWKDVFIEERGCPYISHARATMTRKALDVGAEVIVYLDYDLSFEPADLLALIEAPDEVNAGTYRFKKEPESYMGTLQTMEGYLPTVRKDGAILAEWVPAGFLKVTKAAIQKVMRAYPELLYGDPTSYHVDLFNHGAHKGIWYGEDYGFSRRWNDLGCQIWLLPNLNINHHSATAAFMGNFHEFMLRQPGGSKEVAA